MFVNVTTKSAQHAHARMIAIIVEKVQTQVICMTMVSWIIPIVRQSVNHKKNHLSDSETAEELH